MIHRSWRQIGDAFNRNDAEEAIDRANKLLEARKVAQPADGRDVLAVTVQDLEHLERNPLLPILGR